MGCFGCKKKTRQDVNRCKKKTRQDVNSKPSNFDAGRAIALPEPEDHGPSLKPTQASFRIRAQPACREANRRNRVASAPSMLAAADGAILSSAGYVEQEESSPLPLPCPYLRSMTIYKSSSMSNCLLPSTTLPLPPLGGAVRKFSFEEISAACRHFSGDRCLSEGASSRVYKASFGDGIGSSKKLEATVTCLLPSSQGLKEFMNEVNTIASLQHPNLCKLLGFHAHEGSDQQMLVYEKLSYGSFDRLLFGGSDVPSVDWSTRIKVALCAAQGLAFLHEEGPFQAMYNEFSTVNIQINKDFSAKLSGYGFARYYTDTQISNTSAASANLPMVTLERGLLTPKSNVWSFGVLLLELLTGRRKFDSRRSNEESNIIKWSRPFLADDSRLSFIMDPHLKGRFPLKAARTVADIALRCLRKESSERPTMRVIVEVLKQVEGMKYSSRFPIQDPVAVVGKEMLKSPSLCGIISPAPRLNCSPSLPSISRLSLPPSSSINLSFPP